MSRWAALRPTAVNSILADVRAVQASGRSVVSLMRGEPDLPTPAHVIDAATGALARGRTGYPDNHGEPVLREAIALKLQRDNGLDYSAADEILVTTGATFGIYAALMALVEPGDEVLLPDPVYDAYQSPIMLAGGRSRAVRASLETRGRRPRFSLTREALEEAVSPASRVLLLNTPWNPVGTVLDRAELEAVAEFVLHRNLALVSDEIYEAIVYDGQRHVSPATLSPELRARTVLVNSLSKTYAMTGWRVGYCSAPAALIRTMFLVLQQSSRGPSTFVQDAAAAALTGPQACVREMCDIYAARRATVLTALSGIPGVRVVPPEGGFFAMLDARERGEPSDVLRRRLLHEAGVAVAHGAAYGAGGEGTLRVSFASGGDALAEGLARLRDGLGPA